jgi:hypothetical protein
VSHHTTHAPPFHLEKFVSVFGKWHHHFETLPLNKLARWAQNLGPSFCHTPIWVGPPPLYCFMGGVLCAFSALECCTPGTGRIAQLVVAESQVLVYLPPSPPPPRPNLSPFSFPLGFGECPLRQKVMENGISSFLLLEKFRQKAKYFFKNIES